MVKRAFLLASLHDIFRTIIHKDKIMRRDKYMSFACYGLLLITDAQRNRFKLGSITTMHGYQIGEFTLDKAPPFKHLIGRTLTITIWLNRMN